MTFTRVHTSVSFANPYLRCDTCGDPVPRWHDRDACGCTDAGLVNLPAVNIPCGHVGVTSECPSWGPVDGCRCSDLGLDHTSPDDVLLVAAARTPPSDPLADVEGGGPLG